MSSWNASRKARAVEEPQGPREYRTIQPSAENRWLFAPRSYGPSYDDWPSIDELFDKGFQGVNPNRGIEGSVIDVDRSVLESRMQEYFSDLPFADLKKRHAVLCENRARYDARATRDKLRKTRTYDGSRIVPYALFPFDVRWIYWEREAKFLNECRAELWDNLADNEFLVGVPQARKVSESRPVLLTTLFDLHLHDRGSVGVPAYVIPEQHDGGLFAPKRGEETPRANFVDSVWAHFRESWKLAGDVSGQDAKWLARALLRVCLCICHAPQYESDNGESLAHDWARIPVPRTRAVFEQLAALGEQVRTLLDPLSDPTKVLRSSLGKEAKGLATVRVANSQTVKESDLTVSYSYYGGSKGKWQSRPFAAGEATRPDWGPLTGDLFLNDRVSLANVPEKVWQYELGGYPVLKKWLGGRDAGRRNGPLTLQELQHLRTTVLRLAALLALRPQLDSAYEAASADAFSAAELGLAPGFERSPA